MQWFVLLCVCVITFRVEENVKIFLYINYTLYNFHAIRFLGSYDISGTDVMSNFSNMFQIIFLSKIALSWLTKYFHSHEGRVSR